MSWGTKTSATQLTSISSTEQFFDALISLNPRETAHIQVAFDPVSTPTDDLFVAVYGTLDASSEVWDIQPIITYRLSRLSDPNRVSFLLSGYYRLRVGVRATGATNTHTSADMSYRKDGLGA